MLLFAVSVADRVGVGNVAEIEVSSAPVTELLTVNEGAANATLAPPHAVNTELIKPNATSVLPAPVTAHESVLVKNGTLTDTVSKPVAIADRLRDGASNANVLPKELATVEVIKEMSALMGTSGYIVADRAVDIKDRSSALEPSLLSNVTVSTNPNAKSDAHP